MQEDAAGAGHDPGAGVGAASAGRGQGARPAGSVLELQMIHLLPVCEYIAALVL